MKESGAGLSYSSLVIVLLVTVFFAYFHRWKGEDGNGWEALIDGDSKGYYAYLPAYFIYNDPGYSFFNDPEKGSISRYYSGRLLVSTEQGTVNKNYTGVAVMLTPFFFLGHTLAIALNEPLSGYSWPYFFMVMVASLVYFLAGLYFLRKILRTYQIGDATIGFILLMTGLGTNLLYYTSIHAAMSHVYSFALISAFVYFMRMYCLNISRWYLIVAGVLLAFIVLVRPVNLLVVMVIPFLAGSTTVLYRAFISLFNKPVYLVAAIFAFGGIVFIQFYMFHWQSGSWWVWSYGEEGFIFSNPQIYKVLFSFRKGLFIYTPVLLMIIPGLIYMFRVNRYEFFTYTGNLLLLIFVISSWWNWYYGDGFGQRAFIDYYSILMIPASLALQHIRSIVVKAFVFFFLSVLITVSLIQNYAYRYQIIHPSSMNFEKYKYVFLKTGDRFRNVLGTDTQLVFGRLEPLPEKSWNNDGESHIPFWNSSNIIDAVQNPAYSGTKVISYTSNNEYGPAFEIKGANFITGKPVYCRTTVWWLQQEDAACKSALVIIEVNDSTGRNKHWFPMQLADMPRKADANWRKSHFGIILPTNIAANDVLKVYVWNRNKTNFFLDDFKVTFLNVQPFD